MKKIPFLLTCIGMLSFTSCVDKAYDLDNVDPTVAIGGDSISMPFVNSMKLYMKDIIDTSKNKLLKVNEQGYCIQKNGVIGVTVPKVEVPSVSDQQYTGKALVIDFTSLLSTAAADGLQPASSSPLHAQAKDSIQTTLSIAFPKEILALDSVSLNGTMLNVHLAVQGLPAWNGMKLTGKVNIPAIFNISDPAVVGNVWTFTQDITSATTVIDKQLPLAGLVLSGKEIGADFKIDEKIVYEIAIDVPAATLPVSVSSASITPTISLKNIVPHCLKGIFDVSFDKIKEVFDLGKELTEIFGEYSYFNVEPVIKLDLQSNLGIPMMLDATINGTNKGVTADSVSFDLWTEASPSPAVMASTKFWIAQKSQGKPAAYNYVEVPGLNHLIGSLPDQLELLVDGYSKPATSCSYILKTDYKASVKYDINVPLALGESSHILYEDTVDIEGEMEGLPSSRMCIEVYGSVLNTIPLNVGITLTPADAKGLPLDIEPVHLKINECNADGTAVLSNVSVKLTDTKGELKKMKKLITKVIIATVEGHTTPIKPDNGLDITLKLRFPGGIIIEDSEK